MLKKAMKKIRNSLAYWQRVWINHSENWRANKYLKVRWNMLEIKAKVKITILGHVLGIFKVCWHQVPEVTRCRAPHRQPRECRHRLAAYWLASLGWFSLLSYPAPTHLPRGRGRPILTSNQETVPQKCPEANPWRQFLSWDFLFLNTSWFVSHWPATLLYTWSTFPTLLLQTPAVPASEGLRQEDGKVDTN